MPLQKQPKTLSGLSIASVIENVDQLCRREKQRECGMHFKDLRKKLIFYNMKENKYRLCIFNILQLLLWRNKF